MAVSPQGTPSGKSGGKSAAKPAAKPTLDKDLEKLARTEEASLHFMQRLASPAFALVALVMAGLIGAGFMMGEPGAGVVVAAGIIAAYMAMNIGANDINNNMGPTVGAGALSMGMALGLAAIFEVAGALISGNNVVSTISDGLVDQVHLADPQVFIAIMISALAGAAVWVNIANMIRAPISTTHSIIGAVCGTAIAAAGPAAVQWLAVARIAGGWLATPLIAGVVAAALLYVVKETVIYRADKIAAAKAWVPTLVSVMAGSFATYLAVTLDGRPLTLPFSLSLAIGVGVGFLAFAITRPLILRQAEGLENRNQSLRKLFRLPLIGAALLLSFAHGANDISNAVGPVGAIVKTLGGAGESGDATVPMWVMVIGGFGISVGLVLFGPPLIRLVGEEITRLNPMRAFCVLLATALTVIAAISIGLPVSTTHISIGAVFGVGFFREWYTRNSARRSDYIKKKAGAAKTQPEHNPDEVRRRRLVRRSHVLTILAAWLITLPTAAIISALVYLVLSPFIL